MNKKFTHFLAFLFLVNSLFAQQTAESDRLIAPSPTAGSLGKYGDYPVSLFSGQVNIDIPLFKIVSGKLTLPVSLSYNSTGNKPSDIPGWVGLGWNLFAGGVITRTIRDLPDDGVGGYYGSRNEIRTALQLEEAGTPNDNFSIEYVNRQRDVKQDIFQFNFDGRTGKLLHGQRHIMAFQLETIKNTSQLYTKLKWEGKTIIPGRNLQLVKKKE
ncbi:hypothetical protein [Pseudobacter ginsenosidimutans]|uniref:Virulence plasmid B protein n=1 Tax=Pseudobacter ginsenosidimutans TaxID=661488 RepID=A0A4V2F290_9BACT|nr:hypothetical protein [Pseudobacter ginsenosidimutans]RZS76447.1 hypothetical protein EV199_2332 [Pseudobacter ginsenosidimutans]